MEKELGHEMEIAYIYIYIYIYGLSSIHFLARVCSVLPGRACDSACLEASALRFSGLGGYICPASIS